MGLIRALLLRAEEQLPGGNWDPFLPGFNRAQVVFNLALMIEAGLLRGTVVETEMGQMPQVIVDRLSWDGYEFIANARNDGVWNRVVAQVKQHGMSVSLEVLKELLVVAVRGVFSQGP